MLEFILPDWGNAPANIGALSTTRQGGISHAPYDDGVGSGGLNLGMHVGDNPEHVLQNRALLKARLPSEPAWLSQVHGADVLDAATVKNAPAADASITAQAGVVCVVQTADCLPVLFCDTRARVVGAAHAGWRGLAQGVLDNTVECMRNTGAGEILAWMGPAIGPTCFEVGQDVYDVFAGRDSGMAAAFVPVTGQPKKYLADIYLLARLILAKIGVTRVGGAGLCTVTDKQRFYSYRRDRTTGRMASLIWIK